MGNALRWQGECKVHLMDTIGNRMKEWVKIVSSEITQEKLDYDNGKDFKAEAFDFSSGAVPHTNIM